ncbi:hypothetical protein BLS_008218 [Venturia inaequalis]|uniref:UBC core domain-containing protein n=1 Tax=Venturia inaequalis TaxID=5025 RepID=A0A8H3U7Q4_VENIN|nr:hypothetical protein BLS_008218 [Venturia inaequalis]
MSQPNDKDKEIAKKYQERFQKLDQQKATHTSSPASPAPAPPGVTTYHKPLPSFGPTQPQPPAFPSFGSAFPNPFNPSPHENHLSQPYLGSPHHYFSHAPLSLYGHMQTPGSSSSKKMLQSPYGYVQKPGPFIFDPFKELPTLEDGSEKVARELQATFDAEMASVTIPSMWPNASPFQSDKEYAMSLADGFDQQSGSPIAHSNTSLASPFATSSADMDGEYARQLQAELDAGGLHRTGAGRQNTFQPKEEQTVEIDLETDAVPLHAFGQQTLKKECASCKKHLLNSEKDVIQLTEKWLDKKGRVDSVLQCAKCLKNTCIGCGKLHKPYKPTSSPKDTTAEITMCCQDGRLFLIWALLCAAEHQKACKGRRDELFSKSTSSPRRANSDPPKSRRAIRPYNGTGYGGGPESYADFYDENDDIHLDDFPHNYLPPKVLALARRGRAAARPVAKPKDNTEDLLLTQVYSALTQLLPSLKGHPFDLEPPEVLAIMLKRSPVLEKAAELLRNDSLDDMTNRFKLYEALLGFVERLAGHSATAQTILAPGIVYPADAGLLSASFGENRYELRSSDKGRFKAETSRAISEVVLQLENPTSKMLQRSKAAKEDFETIEGQNMLSLCREVCKLAEFLKVNQQPSYNGKGKEPVKSQENLLKWHQEHCVDEVPDETFSTRYYFWKEQSKNDGVPAKGRMKSLMTELATLQTSLPEGIYVRHGSSRLDMMKVIIIGPHGSPYEGGLFEFDLWCPLPYPNTPPKMQFKTTGGGTAHFNPNLYTDGKVCLSLLGTWQGQPWIAAGPNKSTLLQLLISIQAMILCAEPWYNEPGREVRPNPAISADYNRYIQGLTIPHALTSWLRRDKVDDPIWKEVIEKHFHFNGQAILRSVRAWSEEAEEYLRKTALLAPMIRSPPLPGHLVVKPPSEMMPDFIEGVHPVFGRMAIQIPALARDFEKALQATFGIMDMENGNAVVGGEGKRKFGEA